MTYVIGLTGSHGTGKSTILRGVADLNFPVSDVQLSRSAQKSLGWDNLSRATESEKDMWSLQEAILAAMYDRDIEIVRSHTITLVDRTPADAWGYASIWISKLKEKGKYVDEAASWAFKARCREMAVSHYHQFLIVPIRDEIKFVEEPNRASIDTRNLHERGVERFILSGDLPYSYVKSVSIDERVAEVSAWLTCGKASR